MCVCVCVWGGGGGGDDRGDGGEGGKGGRSGESSTDVVRRSYLSLIKRVRKGNPKSSPRKLRHLPGSRAQQTRGPSGPALSASGSLLSPASHRHDTTAYYTCSTVSDPAIARPVQGVWPVSPFPYEPKTP